MTAETPHEHTGPKDWTGIEREAVHVSADDSLPENYGLNHVLTRIAAERRATTEERTVRQERWWARLGRCLTLGHGLAIACTLLLVQGALILHLWPPRSAHDAEYAIVRALPGTAGQHEPFIRVAFHPQASERDLRTLLVQVQADVVAGPTQLGDYFLLVPVGHAQSVLKILKASPLIEGAELVDELPGSN